MLKEEVLYLIFVSRHLSYTLSVVEAVGLGDAKYGVEEDGGRLPGVPAGLARLGVEAEGGR